MNVTCDCCDHDPSMVRASLRRTMAGCEEMAVEKGLADPKDAAAIRDEHGAEGLLTHCLESRMDLCPESAVATNDAHSSGIAPRFGPRKGHSVPLRRATAINQLNICSLSALLDLVGKNPSAAARHLSRMNVTAEDVSVEFEGRRALGRMRSMARAERKRREDERMAIEREAWKATPLGQQTILVDGLEDYLLDVLKDGEEDTERYRDALRDLDEAQRRLDEMSGRRRPRRPRRLAGAPTAHAVFHGSDASATRAYYRRLSDLGFDGRLAVQLMRVQKASSRAKLYRGEHGRHAYRNKEQAMAGLTALLAQSDCGLKWGWGVDDSPGRTHPCRHVLYVDLPTGQVSFHAMARGAGPDYAGGWDGVSKASEGRVVTFAQVVERGGLANSLDATAV